MNGAMEEPMETSPPVTPTNKPKCEASANTLYSCTSSPTDHNDVDTHDETDTRLRNKNYTDQQHEDRQTYEKQSTPSTSNNGINNIEEKELESNLNQSDIQLIENVVQTINVPKQESSNNMENDCSNSESCPESINGSLAKAVVMNTNTTQYSQEKYSGSECSCIQNVENEEYDEVNSVDSHSTQEDSDQTDEPRAEDTVSINSDSEDDETSQESHTINRNNDIILIETGTGSDTLNGNSQDSHSSEDQILSDNDDCVMTEEKIDSSSVSNGKMQLRRSNRKIKRKRYEEIDLENGNDDSDIEEVFVEEPLRYKIGKPIIVNDTKALVEMASKQVKVFQNKPTLVIINTNSIAGRKSLLQAKNTVQPTSSMGNAQELYQSIVARGTTVTPVSNSKASVATQSSPQASQAIQTPILPSLTDDMFVVEAPSFIVPYVYEKPSIKPFRVFVDNLGKEIADQRAKEEQEKLEKEREEKTRKDKEKVGDRTEEGSKKISDTDRTEKDDTKKKTQQKKEHRKPRCEDDDASWDENQSSSNSDDEITDDENKTLVIKDKVDPLDDIKEVTGLTIEKVCPTKSEKSDNYFDGALGKFFTNIGLNLVQEFVQTDLLKQQNRKLNKEKKTGASTKATEASINSLTKNLEFSKQKNSQLKFLQQKCEPCSFKTYSMLVMAHHLETPHMKNNVYKCNYCPFEIRSPRDILFHMEAVHQVRGKLEKAPAYHQCPNCPFEDNGKGKLARHLISCSKKFKPDFNLSPPIEWEPPAKIPKMTRARNSIMGPYQSMLARGQSSGISRAAAAGSLVTYRPHGRSPALYTPAMVRPGLTIRPTPMPTPTNTIAVTNGSTVNKFTVHQPSISITPLPRATQPAQTSQTKNSFVICEICDGYIKDLEQLRTHMQWIHKVKIHPRMLYNRPPLNCQKCQFRFFTDQGLERHLLGSHGLVTSSMQEYANKGKDAGRCPVCGRVYQWDLLNHVGRDHNLQLKPAHLSYKCTVCTATFSMYKQFESHVYSSHSVVAKRAIDKKKLSAPSSKSDSLLKPLKINDEITIIPQPLKPATPPADAATETFTATNKD